MRYERYTRDMVYSSTRLSLAVVLAIVVGQIGLLLSAEYFLGSHDPHPLVEAVPGVQQARRILTTTLQRWSAAQTPMSVAAPSMHEGKLPSNATVPKITTLHEEARIFLVEDFLTPEECDHIIELAKDRLTRSGVVDGKGGTMMDSIRTSSGVFLDRWDDPVIMAVDERIAKLTMLPLQNQESLQVLRYESTQKYGAHYDYFFDESNTRKGGNRYATFLMYLNDVEEGGETTFTKIPAPNGDNGPEFSECARHVLAAKPKKGSAVLFHSMTLSGKLERRSMHEACPVIRGEKWSAPKWIHEGAFQVGKLAAQPPEEGDSVCEDKSNLCEGWAQNGECERNKAFMLGAPGYPGNCLKSCKKCDMLRMGLGESNGQQETPKRVNAPKIRTV